MTRWSFPCDPLILQKKRGKLNKKLGQWYRWAVLISISRIHGMADAITPGMMITISPITTRPVSNRSIFERDLCWPGFLAYLLPLPFLWKRLEYRTFIHFGKPPNRQKIGTEIFLASCSWFSSVIRLTAVMSLKEIYWEVRSSVATKGNSYTNDLRRLKTPRSGGAEAIE